MDQPLPAGLSDPCLAWLEKVRSKGVRIPHELLARFPHIAERLCSAWADNDAWKPLIDSLLSRNAGSGLPPSIIICLTDLRELRSTLFADSGGGWLSIPRL